jgi:hypothetical protein
MRAKSPEVDPREIWRVSKMLALRFVASVGFVFSLAFGFFLSGIGLAMVM